MRTLKKKYTTIIFDFGGVLCAGENMRAMARHLARKHHVDFDLLRETILKRWLEARVNAAKDVLFWKSIARVLGTTDARARREILAYSKLKPDMIHLVKTLQKRYRTALLSNQIVGWLGVYIKRHSLRRIFDVIVPSYDAKFAKPHINIYKITLKKLREPASACIFIDDLGRNLIPARDLGITTIHFRSATQVKRDLKRLGIS